MENSKPKFISGLFVNKPSDKAPDYVKAKMSVSADTFIPFLKENVNGKGYLNFDILESKDGKFYAKLDDFVPNQNYGTESDLIAPKQDEINIDEIPFN
jgi:hypothetical protein